MDVLSFVCPVCKAPLQPHRDGYACSRDELTFRRTLGILDFRVPVAGTQPEPVDARVMRLLAKYDGHTFAELLDDYSALFSSRSPAKLVQWYIIHACSSAARSEYALAEIRRSTQLSIGSLFLELGCGTGGFLVAAARQFERVIGLDIELARLILARKQLEEAGQEATLICADAQYLPFPENLFHLVVAIDLLEHVAGQKDLICEAHRVLAPSGVLFLATPNRWSLAPESHVKVWGLGFLPRAWRDPVVRFVRNQPYKRINTLNYFDLRRLIAQSGFGRCEILLPAFHPEHIRRLSAWERIVIPFYHALKELPLVKGLIYLFGPLFHAICVKPAIDGIRSTPKRRVGPG